MKFRPPALFLWSLALAASLGQVSAATLVWDGGGTDNSWGTANNWNTNTVPATATPFDDVQFAGAVRPNVDISSNVTIQTLKFNSGATAFTVGGSGTITLKGSGTTTTGDNGIDIVNDSSVLQTINNNLVIDTPSNFAGFGFRANNGNLTFNGGIDITATTNVRFLAGGNRVMTFNGVISGTGGGAIAFNSGGTFVINGVNTYTKGTSIWSGTVKVGVDSLNGANGAFGNSTTPVNLGTTFDGVLSPTLLTTNAVTIGRNILMASPHVNRAATPHTFVLGGESAHVSNYTGTITNSSSGGTLAANKLTVIAASGGRVNIANIVRGSGATGTLDDVVKTGAGIVAITGTNNNWQGNTLIQAGTFLVNGSILSSPSGKNAQVSGGATLGGMGLLSRDVELASTAILSPGDVDSAGNSLGGKLTLGAAAGLGLNAGSVLRFDLATPSSTIDDEVSVIGNMVLAGILNVNDFGGFGLGEYKLFDWTGTLTYDPSNFSFGTMPSGFNYAIDTTTHSNAAYLVVTPEPSRALLMVAGICVTLCIRRRKTA